MSEVLPFDREYSLADLLPPALRERVGAAVAALLPGPAAIVDDQGGVLWGGPADASGRQPLVFELEPLGYLVGPPGPALKAAATLLEQLIVARARYHMTSHLHVEAVSADYAQLKQKHAALQDSEARYRALSGQLEQRVAAQVQVIEERQRQLYQVEKLASVGQLAAGMAHEINNPIGFIRSNLVSLGRYFEGFAELRRRLPDAAAWAELDLDYVLADAPELIQDCLAGADRIADIIRNLKEFSNVDSAERRTVDLNDNLRHTCALYASRLPDGVALVTDLQPLPALACQPGHLNQVFMNLIANALQAAADRGEAGGEVRVTSAPQAGGIRIQVVDNGVGIPPERLARIFEPFYTTRPVGQGTGLGLTVARDIVEAHGGRIELDSQPGCGTCATLFLPA